MQWMLHEEPTVADPRALYRPRSDELHLDLGSLREVEVLVGRTRVTRRVAVCRNDAAGAEHHGRAEQGLE